MSLYSLKAKVNPELDISFPKSIDWLTVGEGVLTGLGVTLVITGVKKKEPIPSVVGIAMAGGGGYLLYKKFTAKEEVPVEPGEMGYVIRGDKYANSVDWGDWLEKGGPPGTAEIAGEWVNAGIGILSGLAALLVGSI